MWRGDAGTSVEGTNDGAAGMYTLQGKRDGNGVRWAGATERGHVAGPGGARNETLGLLVLPTRRPVSPAPPAPLCVRSGGGKFPGTSRAFGCLRRAGCCLRKL